MGFLCGFFFLSFFLFLLVSNALINYMQINTALNKTGSILSLLRVIVNFIMLTFFTKRCKLRFARKRKSECVFTEQRKRTLRFKLDVNIRGL